MHKPCNYGISLLDSPTVLAPGQSLHLQVEVLFSYLGVDALPARPKGHEGGVVPWQGLVYFQSSIRYR